MTLVGNTILAVWILKEPFHLYDGIGVSMVIIGSVFSIVFGPQTKSYDITIEYLVERWRQASFYLFFILLLIIYVADYIYVKILERHVKEHNQNVTDDHIEQRKIPNDSSTKGMLSSIRRLSTSHLQEHLNELSSVVGVSNLKNFSDYNSFLISYAC